MTDQQLIDRFRQGDVQAFNVLVWRWQRPIYNFVLRFLGNEEDARDVTQKTFLRAFQNLKRLKNTGRFRSWLYQIAINLCRDEHKRKRRSNSLEWMQENGQLAKSHVEERSSAEDPERDIQENEVQALLRKALLCIPEEQRMVVIMKELLGYKFTEIADILDIPVNTAKSRMYYGLNALRKVFAQWNIDREAIYHEL